MSICAATKTKNNYHWFAKSANTVNQPVGYNQNIVSAYRPIPVRVCKQVDKVGIRIQQAIVTILCYLGKVFWECKILLRTGKLSDQKRKTAHPV